MIEDIYECSNMRIKSICVTEDFGVEIGVHQGSSLNPLLFSFVMDKVMNEIQGEVP